MRKIFYGILALAAVFFGSCVNESENPAPIKAGEQVNVKFFAGLQASAKPGTTRAVAGVDDEDTGLSGLLNLENQAQASGTALYSLRYTVKILDVAGSTVVYQDVVTKDIDGQNPSDLRTLDFSAILTTGREYRTVIWADITHSNSATTDFYYDLTNWPTVELTSAALTTVNAEAKDAYFANDTRVSDGQPVTMTLKRPFGKIRFLVRDYGSALSDDPTSGQASGKSEQDEMETESNYLTASPVYTKFDASTGEVDLTATDVNTDVNAHNSVENGGAELATFWDYVLAPSADQIDAGAARPQVQFHVGYKAKQGTPNAIVANMNYTDARIVVERNKLTTVRDNLFDFAITRFTVTVDDFPFDGENIPLRATVRCMSGDTLHISIQRDPNGIGTFSCPHGIAGITLINTTKEILIGSAAGREVTLKFDAATDTVVPRIDAGGETLINTVAELAFVKQKLNGTYKLESDVDLAVGGTVGSPATPLEWTPIGNNGTLFTGTFNGDGHTVGNLKISSGSGVGFFGVTDVSSVIKNLGVSGDVSGTGNVGGVVGAASGTITGCSFDGTVTGTGSNVGGITGAIRTQGGTVTACHSSATVKGTGGVGGLVGIIQNSPNKVTACYSTATVTGPGGSLYGTNGTGTVTGCFTNGTAQTGVLQFSATNWPADSGEWGIGSADGSGTGNYWKDLGSYSATNPVYPKLWWE